MPLALCLALALFVGASDPAYAIESTRVSWAGLGVAYIFFLANLVIGGGLFVASRWKLVVSTGRGTRNYAMFVTVLTLVLMLATVLENELLQPGIEALPYEAVPNILLVFLLHLWALRFLEPWLVESGMAALTGAVIVGGVFGIVGLGTPRPAHWVIALVSCGVLIYLWIKSISTAKSFLTADSIYVNTKELQERADRDQKPWLGLPQWVALIGCSIALAVINQLLSGTDLELILATSVLFKTALLLLTTLSVSALPAAGYWYLKRQWMPELTQFVWIAWLITGFAMTYSNYLISLQIG